MLTQTAGLPEKSGTWDAAVRSRGGDPKSAQQKFFDRMQANPLQMENLRRAAEQRRKHKAARAKGVCDSRELQKLRRDSALRDSAIAIVDALAGGLAVPAALLADFEYVVRLALESPDEYAAAAKLGPANGRPRKGGPFDPDAIKAAIVDEMPSTLTRAFEVHLRADEKIPWENGQRADGTAPRNAFEAAAALWSDRHLGAPITAGAMRGAWQRMKALRKSSQRKGE
ncbi:hypothetical protein [Panacagrimonas sp.]|uniref:hypothetical protein n=1 Tax=Panacagrimonas sp. TaxID=2480088 RepID=UPI003B52410B